MDLLKIRDVNCVAQLFSSSRLTERKEYNKWTDRSEKCTGRRRKKKTKRIGNYFFFGVIYIRRSNSVASQGYYVVLWVEFLQFSFRTSTITFYIFKFYVFLVKLYQFRNILDTFRTIFHFFFFFYTRIRFYISLHTYTYTYIEEMWRIANDFCKFFFPPNFFWCWYLYPLPPEWYNVIFWKGYT